MRAQDCGQGRNVLHGHGRTAGTTDRSFRVQSLEDHKCGHSREEKWEEEVARNNEKS